MWVRRGKLYTRPGLMAEAVAHIKTMPPQEGVRVRLLRPVTGPECTTQLIMEVAFEDLDAQVAPYGSPSPAGEWMKRWLELNESRGIWDLFQVQHEVPAEGKPGLWVDRRIRYVQDGRRGEALRRWRNAPAVPAAGMSLRVLTPRAGERVGNIIVVETTFDSVVEFDGALGELLSAPQGSAWAASAKALEMHEPTMELLRVVP